MGNSSLIARTQVGKAVDSPYVVDHLPFAFETVDFHYPDEQHAVFKGVEISIRQGQMVPARANSAFFCGREIYLRFRSQS